MTLSTEELIQYFLIFLVVLWPVWVLSFVFLRAIALKTGSLFRSKKIALPALPAAVVHPRPVEKPTGS